MQANFAVKANVADVSRTIADIQVSLEARMSPEDVRNMMEDRITKDDIQYMLSNKVSLEELSRVLVQKSNIHEVNLELNQLNQRIDEISKDFNKRLCTGALQKDLAYWSTVVDGKSDLDYVNESLSQKANK